MLHTKLNNAIQNLNKANDIFNNKLNFDLTIKDDILKNFFKDKSNIKIIKSLKEKILNDMYKEIPSYNIVRDLLVHQRMLSESADSTKYSSQFIRWILGVNECPIINLRQNQKNAIDKLLEHNFSSGIISHYVGTGKTIIMLNTIWLHYLKHKNNKNLLYILLCDKSDILYQMFFKNGDFDISIMESYSSSNIFDHTKFNIVNCIDPKNKKNKINFDVGEPTIIITNTQFIKNRNYSDIKKGTTGLILLDECHSVTGKENYKMLKILKYKKLLPIIGLSATPYRKMKNSIPNLKDIFSNTFDKNDDKKELNIISSYDMIDAICDDVVLPYSNILFVESIKRGYSKNISNTLLKKVINTMEKKLIYKKFVVYCDTIESMNQYYNFLESEYKNYQVFRSSSHSESNDQESIDLFKDCENYAIMVCVDRFREGSDMKNLECAILVDNVINRSIKVFIQVAGRLQRLDSDKKKKKGFIVEVIVKYDDENINMITIERVIEYYKNFVNLGKGTLEDIKKLEQLKKNIEFDTKKKKILIKLDKRDDHDIEIDLSHIEEHIDWDDIKKVFIEKLLSQRKKYIDYPTVYFIRITDTSKDNFNKTILKRLKNISPKACLGTYPIPQWGFRRGKVNGSNVNMWLKMKLNPSKSFILFGSDKNKIFYFFKILEVFENEDVGISNWGNYEDGNYSLLMDVEKITEFKYTFTELKTLMGYSDKFNAQGPVSITEEKINVLKNIPSLSEHLNKIINNSDVLNNYNDSTNLDTGENYKENLVKITKKNKDKKIIVKGKKNKILEE